MKTNFEMIMELDKEFTPKKRHIVSIDEIYFINEKLCLDEMDILQLRNLRDFTVMFYDIKREEFDFETIDKMSAIVSVIDSKLFQKGAEV